MRLAPNSPKYKLHQNISTYQATHPGVTLQRIAWLNGRFGSLHREHCPETATGDSQIDLSEREVDSPFNPSSCLRRGIKPLFHKDCFQPFQPTQEFPKARHFLFVSETWRDRERPARLVRVRELIAAVNACEGPRPRRNCIPLSWTVALRNLSLNASNLLKNEMAPPQE